MNAFLVQICPAIVIAIGVFINSQEVPFVKQSDRPIAPKQSEGPVPKVEETVKIEGPVAVEVTKTVKLVLTNYDSLKDVKIASTPKCDCWEALRRLDGTPLILFTPEKVGTFTFALAGNKDGKTVLVIHSITVVGLQTPEPDQALPKPPAKLPDQALPKPATSQLPAGKYSTKLKDFIELKTEAQFESLVKLVDIYTTFAKQVDSIKTAKHLLGALEVAAKAVPEFSGLKLEVTMILEKELTVYSPDLAKTTLDEIVKSIKALIPQ